jgi:hypothetical protein
MSTPIFENETSSGAGYFTFPNPAFVTPATAATPSMQDAAPFSTTSDFAMTLDLDELLLGAESIRFPSPYLHNILARNPQDPVAWGQMTILPQHSTLNGARSTEMMQENDVADDFDLRSTQSASEYDLNTRQRTSRHGQPLSLQTKTAVHPLTKINW